MPHTVFGLDGLLGMTGKVNIILGTEYNSNFSGSDSFRVSERQLANYRSALVRQKKVSSFSTLEDGVSINGVWENFTENIKISAKLSLDR
jgi:hypothetical protein